MQLFEISSFLFAELRPWLKEHVKPLPGPWAIRRSAR